MRVREIMSNHVVCCTPDTSLKEVARLMSVNDCGDIPVVQDGEGRRPVGVITDRDITCRAVAEGLNPLELTAADCMSKPVVTVTPDTVLEECCHTMERNQIRRVPVVDERGACCGVVSQADIARVASESQAGHVLREVSRQTSSPSRVS
jgi:CBS domain-containing protein